MHIAKQYYLTLSLYRFDKFFCCVYCWVQYFVWELPSTVQIAPCQRTSVVAVNYSVRVQHRDNFKDKVVSEQLSLLIGRISQEIYQATHHPRAHCFSRVNARGQKDTLFFIFRIFFDFASRSNSNEWTIYTSDCFAQTGYLEEIASHRVNFNLIQIGLQIAERIWLEVAEEHGILVVLECVGECCCEVVSRETACISSDLILEV